MSGRNHAPWCTFEHEGACPHENTVQAIREGRLPMPPARQRFSRWFTEWPSTHVNSGMTVEVMPVSEHEAVVAELENRVVCKRQAFEVAEGGRKLWMERAEEAEAELRAARQMGAGLVTALNAKQAVDEPMVERAARALCAVDGGVWEHCSEHNLHFADARAVLADALAVPESERADRPVTLELATRVRNAYYSEAGITRDQMTVSIHDLQRALQRVLIEDGLQ